MALFDEKLCKSSVELLHQFYFIFLMKNELLASSPSIYIFDSSS